MVKTGEFNGVLERHWKAFWSLKHLI